MRKYTIGILLLIIVQFTNAQLWQQIGPAGGYFKEFTIHPTNTSTVFAGSDDGGGIWKTTNGGDSWNLLTADFPNMTGWKITISEISPDTIYVCEMYGRYGVLKSTDGGLTWSQISNGLNTAYDKMVTGLVIQNVDTLLISTGESSTSIPARNGNGIFISTNGGYLWTPAGLQGYTVPCINRNIFGTVFAGTESNGLFYTNDNGTNWFLHPNIDANATVHEIDVKDSVIVVAATTGIYLSTNWGMDFTNIGLANAFNFDVAIYKLAPDIEIYGSSITGLQKYSSGTSTWNIVSSLVLSGQIVIGIASDGTNIYASTFSNSPIIKSADGGISWNYLSNNPTATELNDIYIDPVDNNRILGCLIGSYNIGGNFNKECMYETNNGGTSWTRKGPLAHALCFTPNPQNSNAFYLGTYSQGLFKTYNSFSSHTNLISGNKAIGDIAVSNEDTNVVIISEVDWDLIQVAVKRSIDGGISFTTVANLVANRILFNTLNNDTVYTATNNGIYLSVDNGLTWNPWLLSGEHIAALAYEDNILYAGNNQGDLYKIENSTVNNISGAWQVPTEIKSIYTTNGKLFVGLNGAEKDTVNNLFGGIWESSDDGITWTEITDLMTSTNVFGNNTISGDGNELYVGTYGGGIFKSDGLFLDINEKNPKYGIRVFPNPSSGQLTIISETEKIDHIRMFNLIGQDVSSFIHIVSIDDKIVNIDLFGMKSGLYILQVNGLDVQKVYKK